MAKRKAARGAKRVAGRKGAAGSRSTKRPAAKRPTTRQASPKKKKAPAKNARKKASPVAARKKAASSPARRPQSRAQSPAAAPSKVARLDRARRTLDEGETRRTPPSSLDMDRRGSAARTGRAEIAQKTREHHGMNDIAAGDPDVDVENAYFSGEEAPGGDSPTPDQDVVEDIGKALGVTYNDNEELKGADKLVERDKHRWELDPASAEDYTEHDKE